MTAISDPTSADDDETWRRVANVPSPVMPLTSRQRVGVKISAERLAVVGRTYLFDRRLLDATTHNGSQLFATSCLNERLSNRDRIPKRFVRKEFAVPQATLR